MEGRVAGHFLWPQKPKWVPRKSLLPLTEAAHLRLLFARPYRQLWPGAKELWGLSVTELGQLGKTRAQALPAWGHGTDGGRETLVLEAGQ